jgi:hypothetical protein
LEGKKITFEELEQRFIGPNVKCLAQNDGTNGTQNLMATTENGI